MPQSTEFRRSNSRIRTAGLTLLALALLAAAIVAVAVAQSGASKSVAKEAQNPSLGKTVLTSTTGRTLYSLSVETKGKFICTGACLSTWRPLTVPAGVKPTGPVKLGTIERPEGGIQVTYKGRPLYRFGGDATAGEANGEGIKDIGTWHAATPPQPKAEAAPQANPENPYGY